MSRIALVPLVLFLSFAWAPTSAGQHDYTAELTKLIELTDAGQQREAITGYRKLQAQANTPAWLKAAAEYEVADLYAAMGQSDQALAALGRSAQFGYDDCLSPRESKHLKPLLANPKAAQALAGMKISDADFRELAWLKSEVEHAGHDAKTMIADNIDRVDQQETEIPQARLPTRPTTSAGVLYWRQQLLLMQKAQRDFVRQSDEERMVHAATMSVAESGASNSAMLESARLAHAAAAARQADIRKRAFVAPASAGPVKVCTEWAGRAR